MLTLDHLAVAASSLDEGREAVETALGLTLQPGGRHTHFGTHNLLLGLEDGLYLEVISIDPEAPRPSFPRWFDLDRFSGRPRLGNWICRTEDLAAFVARYPRAGRPVALSRGDLRWEMAVPETGVLPFDNLFPAVIRWHGAAHPANRLANSRCRMTRLVVSHPEAGALSEELAPVFGDRRVVFEPGAAALRAEFETPSGPRVLE